MVNHHWRFKRCFGDSWQKRLHARYGPWALVTGASSGIGRALVLRLAEAGLNLVLIARSQAVLEQMAVASTSQYSIKVRVFGLDLSLETALPRWVRVRVMGGVMGGMTKHQRRTISDLAEVE